MKKVILIVATLTIFAMMSSLAFAQANTATGTLAVNVTVNSSINMVFQKDTNGAAISGAGTPNASLTITGVQAFGGTAIPNVTVTPGASSFTVSTPVDVVVTKANSSSATYTLSAQLASADGNSWAVNGTAVTSASAANITTSGAYGTTAEPIAVTIPFTNTSGSVNNTITFTATSN